MSAVLNLLLGFLDHMYDHKNYSYFSKSTTMQGTIRYMLTTIYESGHNDSANIAKNLTKWYHYRKSQRLSSYEAMLQVTKGHKCLWEERIFATIKYSNPKAGY